MILTILSEADVASNHEARWAEALEQFGDKFAVPMPLVHTLQEANRQDWLQFYENGNDDPNRPRRDKTARMMQFVKDNVGQTVSPQGLADAAEAAIGTSYAFIDANRFMFRKVGTGQFLILDTVGDRAAAKSGATGATLPRAASIVPDAVSAEVDIVNGALDRMTGAVAPTRTVGKL